MTTSPWLSVRSSLRRSAVATRRGGLLKERLYLAPVFLGYLLAGSAG